jgi:peptidoglycan/xylan/chitin deacetylase (PgdA/CDA1 family)
MAAADADQRLRRAVRMASHLPRRRPLVLMYHAFGVPPSRSGDPYDLFLPIAHLERQLDLLIGGGWQPVDLDAFVSCYDKGVGAGRFHVTIDDGFASVVSEAAPVLRARGVPATLFILPGLIGETSRWLSDMNDAPLASQEQLAQLKSAGITLAVHGHDHQSMTGMDEEALVLNTRRARDALAAITGEMPRAFAYPFGWHDGPARQAVERAGFDIGFALYDDDGRFAVSRVDVKPSDSITTFCAKLLPAYRRIWRVAGSLRPVRRGIRNLTDRVD